MDHNIHLEKVINHFTHSHPLKLTKLIRYRDYCECYCCESEFDTDYSTYYSIARGRSIGLVMYACEKCKAYLCVLCARLEETVDHHALHPLHPRLKLVDNRSSLRENEDTSVECSACCEKTTNRNNFTYHCDHYDDHKCDFAMHVKCAHSLKPTLTLSHARSRSHSHDLLTLVVSNLSDFTLVCESCHCVIPEYSAFARCVPCNLNYHIYCEKPYYKLPDIVMSREFHTQHNLELHRTRSYWSCDVCFETRDLPNMFVYKCIECHDFIAHISCAFPSLLPCPFSNSVSKFDIVGMRIKGSPMHHEAVRYGCQYCNLYLQQSCIDSWLQQSMVESKKGEIRINHPGYDDNPLVLVFAHAKRFTCSCCEISRNGFMFRGENDVSFVLDLECVFLLPSLELIGHDHRVILLLKLFSNEPYLRCWKCRRSFSIEESSCRFPRTIFHEGHFHDHPLTLVPRLVENDGINHCYCDMCESKRDPNVFVYVCDVCKFEACIKCVKSKVVGTFERELNKVEFVTLQEIEESREEGKKIKIRDVLRLENELEHS